MDETRKDELQDEEIVEQTDNLEEHENSDSEKWDKVFSALDNLTSRLDGFEEWVNEAIGGLDKTGADEAEDTSENDEEGENEVADLDKEFYERQRRYMEEGGY